MQIMFALLGNILTAECGSAYSRNIYIYKNWKWFMLPDQ